jgi:hypothetical protein
VFIDGKVTSDAYLGLLTEEFVAFLLGYGIPTKLVATKWSQTSHQQCRTSLSSPSFRGVSPSLSGQNETDVMVADCIFLEGGGGGKNVAYKLTFKDV